MTALHLEALVDSIPHEMQMSMDATNKKRNRRPMSSGHSTDGSSSESDAPVTPGRAKPKRKNRGKKTRNGQAPSSPGKPEPELSQEEKDMYVAIDCEMVGIGRDGLRSSLARVCMVDWDGNHILDLYVRQNCEVTDYRTFVSGITSEHLTSENAVDFEECRNRVMDLIEGKILVGHALKNDLHVLRISHPWHQVRDTGKYEPFMKIRFDDGILWPRKLKDLAKEKLDRDVQQSGQSHCPFEDAQTALDLYKKVRNKWEKAMEYKIKKTLEIQGKQIAAKQ